MINDILLLIFGMVILVAGAEALVRGSRSIALRLGVSTLVIGLTVVAFGTSAPELFVSVMAAFQGNADVAAGNIIGSNIFNILVIIGLSALITPISISKSIRQREMPIMLFSIGLFIALGYDGLIDRFEGAIIFTGIILYLLYSYVVIKRGRTAALALLDAEPNPDKQHTPLVAVLMILAGFIGLVLGADYIVDSATSLARAFGISDLIIGITLVAVGTSLPELATTVAAALKQESDLAVGNAVGSNIFNVFCVIGITALVTPLAVNSEALSFDMPFMFIALSFVWLLMFSDKLGRIKGGIIIGSYMLYIVIVAQRFIG